MELQSNVAGEDDSMCDKNAETVPLMSEEVSVCKEHRSSVNCDIRDVTNIQRQASRTSPRNARKTSDIGESVKNVSFRLDQICKDDLSNDLVRKDSTKYRQFQRRPETRRSSAHAVLVRHRRLSRQLSSADWDEMTRDSVLRRFSDADSDIWAIKSGKFSTFGTTQVKPLRGLKEGRSLLLEGQLQRKAFTFSIHIQSGPGRMPYADVRTILLMFNPLIPEKKVVCNSFLYGGWGAEEIWDVERLRTESDLEDFPFYSGARFKLKISVNKDYFSVYIDKRHVLDYRHRLTVGLISHLRLEGDACYSNIECPMELDLPYHHEITPGLRPGHVVLLDTFVWKTCKSFEILFSGRQHDVSALFVAQTTFNGDITHIQCNAFLNSDQCEQVLIDGHLPLHRDNEMLLTFIMNCMVIRVYVNQQHFADYEHHLPLEKLTQISVNGDLSLYGIRIKRPPGPALIPLKKASRCCDCTML